MTNSVKVSSLTPAAQLGSPMLCLYGQGVARGYAIGRVVVLGATALEVSHYRISTAQIPSEKKSLNERVKYHTARNERHGGEPA